MAGSHLSGALWSTACQSVEAWRAWTPELAAVSTRRALAFAVLAELGAASSFAVLVVTGFLVLLPHATLAFLTSWHGWTWLVGGTVAFATLMVSLHLLWAVSLEVLIATSRDHGHPAVGHSLGFSLYVCGWDLMTSPLGLAWAVRHRGCRQGMALVASATTVPKQALAHYLIEVRGLRQERARRVALASFSLPLLVAVAVAVMAVGWWWVA